MFKRGIAVIILTCLVSAGLYSYRVSAEQQAVAKQLIRLHVVANSDTAEDQSRKLAVRDAVLAEVASLTSQCTSAQQAFQVLSANLEPLAAAAQAVLEQKGCTDPVQVRLGAEPFPRRDYETFSLPAGVYQSLRITIGNGEGHNWWCVVFPALCLPATTEGFAETAQACGLSGQQTELLTAGEPTVKIKFRVLEWLGSLRDYLS